jgi:hypothetical protein
VPALQTSARAVRRAVWSLAVTVALLAVLVIGLAAQGGQATTPRAAPRRPAPTRTPAQRPTPPATPPMPTVVEVALDCGAPLGRGVQSRRLFCDVMIGRDQAEGIVIPLPPHAGPVTLSFDLHNRHLYSEDLIRSGRAYRRYTATIGVLTSDNTLLSRFVVQNEFRAAADLVERIAADAGPGVVKAVAPSGTETIRLQIPEEETAVSILGERLTVVRPDGVDSFTSPGRPAAVISRVTLEYVPPLPPRPARPAPRRR